MAVIQVYCPACASIDVIKFGITDQNKQRYRCRNLSCSKKTFILDYSNKGCAPGVEEKIIDMALNSSGIRDTSRVLGVSRNTVASTLKKSAVTLTCQSRLSQKKRT